MIKRAIKSIFNLMGFEITRTRALRFSAEEVDDGPAEQPYIERPEYGPSNIRTKLENVAKGLPFEYEEILNLNCAVSKLIGNSRRICELGCGTGTFAAFASVDTNREIVASEFDADTYRWVSEHKPRRNVRYIMGPVPEALGPFDLVVAVEVIEHVADFRGFLTVCQKVAPRVLLTTPNRARGKEYFHHGPPPYYKHVREWTAGEFYWVLRSFYEKVELYALTSQTEPKFIKVSVDTRLSPLIAECSTPTR